LAQFNYSWLAIDYQNLWSLGRDVIETDSFFVLTATTGTPWDPLFGQLICVNKNTWESQIFTPGLFDSFIFKAIELKENPISTPIIACGYYYNGAIETDSVDIFLVELDPITFDTIRLKKFGLPGRCDNLSRMILTQDGGIAITGWSFVSDQKSSIFLFKADSLWNQEYFNLYAQVPNRNHFGNSLVQTPDGGFFIMGNRRMDQDYFMDQAVLLKVDAGGNIQFWKNLLPVANETNLILVDVRQKENGNYFSVGSKQVTTTGLAWENHFWATEFDEEGEMIWSEEYDSAYYCQWVSVQPTLDGDFLVAGFIEEMPFWINDTVFNRQYGTIGKLSPAGELLWQRFYTNEPLNKHVDIFWNAIPTSDGGILCVGTTWGDSLTRQDVWAVKLDEWGCIEPGCEGPTGVVEVDVAPVEVIVYPNPASDKFTLKLHAPLERNAVLQLFNAMGQIIKTYAIPAGYVEYHFLLQAVPSALYFYSLSSDEEIITSGKLIKE